MSHETFFIYLLLMAGTTYLIRAIPFVLVRKRIRNIYIRSFLTYIPYAVLTAMTIPAIFYATGSIWSAAVGLFAAVIMSLFGFGLMPVAVVACVAVYATEWVMTCIIQ
ncbi:MAG: AzlD domain-containing protein [Eubacterium sp.]|nr:AzlD domain-containing protein [Eubacterium sp.]